MRNKQTNQKHVDIVVSVFISHFGCEEAQNEIPPASKFSMTYRQGRTEGWKEVTIPQGAEKSQQRHKYFLLQYNTFASERPQFEHGGAKLASCPGPHLNSLRPYLQDTSNNRQPWC